MIRKLVIEGIIDELKEVRQISTMQSASFDDELKEKTRLWRDTWIVYPLTVVIDNLTEEIKR